MQFLYSCKKVGCLFRNLFPGSQPYEIDHADRESRVETQKKTGVQIGGKTRWKSVDFPPKNCQDTQGKTRSGGIDESVDNRTTAARSVRPPLMDRGSSERLFDVVARLRSGESTSSRDLDEACHEARVLVDQLRALESREAAMLGRLRERDVAIAELRASAEATRAETASLTLGVEGDGRDGETAPAVAEDLWSEPPDVRAWGGEGSGLLHSGGEAAARALMLVALARDVFEQERRLVELRWKVLERAGAEEKSPFEVRWKSEEELAPSSII